MTAVLYAFHNAEINLDDGNLIFSEELECKQKLSHGYELAPICRVTFLPTGHDTAFMDVVELSFRDARVPGEMRVGQRYRMELRLVPVEGE